MDTVDAERGSEVSTPRVWKRILFVFNPVAGRSQIREDLLDIVEILSDQGYEVICYPTKGPGDARRVVRDREDDYLYVACAGGDGTLDEVVSGMMESRDKPFVPIGYIPAGTTNDFASSLGIPSSMRAAARVVASGRVFNCDLGEFNGSSYFTYVAAFGLFTETAYQTPQELKKQLGHLAYVLQGVLEIGKLRTYHVRVTAENLRISDEFAFGMITNSHSVGGFSNITGEGVDMSDGLFEVTLIKMPRNILEINEIIRYLNQNNEQSELIYHFKTSHIVLESQEEISWTRDGEFGGTCRRAELRNLRRQLRILVPAENVKRPVVEGIAEREQTAREDQAREAQLEEAES